MKVLRKVFVLISFSCLMLSGVVVNAQEVDKSTRLVDPVCSYSKKKVENNKSVTFYHPSFKDKWQYANNYYLSEDRGSLSLSFGYGPMSVSYSKSGVGGYTVPADYSQKSKLKMKEIGDVYQVTPSSCNPYYSFKYEIEKAYPVYA